MKSVKRVKVSHVLLLLITLALVGVAFGCQTSTTFPSGSS